MGSGVTMDTGGLGSMKGALVTPFTVVDTCEPAHRAASTAISILTGRIPQHDDLHFGVEAPSRVMR